jgi:hypothetical protein
MPSFDVENNPPRRFYYVASMHGGPSEHLCRTSQLVCFDAKLQIAYLMEAAHPLSMPIRHAASTAFPIIDLIEALAGPGLVNESTKRKSDG